MGFRRIFIFAESELLVEGVLEDPVQSMKGSEVALFSGLNDLLDPVIAGDNNGIRQLHRGRRALCADTRHLKVMVPGREPFKNWCLSGEALEERVLIPGRGFAEMSEGEGEIDFLILHQLQQRIDERPIALSADFDSNFCCHP